VLGLATALGFLGAVLGVAMAARGHDARLEPIIQAPKPAVKGTSQATPKRQATARRHMPIPVRISIPAIGVNASVIRLGLNPDRTIEVPKNFAHTGWFRPGPEPGEQGAAVILGHFDSRSGPAVFFRLRELRAGDVIRVHPQDGSTVRFVARSMLRVAKNRFPTKRVYARTSQPTLRLVTCAGRLNASTGHHDDNYIVFASIRR
jgi:sortase (surface protein transpeptidase)